MQAICTKCMNKHSHNGQNFINIEVLTQQSHQKHQNWMETITDFKGNLSKEFSEKTISLSNFDKNCQLFAENVENQLKEFISHISRILKMRCESQESNKKNLELWVIDAGKAVGTLNRYIEDLSQEMKQNSEFLKKRNFPMVYEKFMEVKKDPLPEFNPLLIDIESKFGLQELLDVEIGAKKFLVEEFMSFAKLEQVKNQEDS